MNDVVRKVSPKCYEATNLNQWIDNVIEVVNHSSNMQEIHKVCSAKDSIEISIEYTVAYEKRNQQSNVLENTSFQEYLLETFSGGFQDFYSVLQQVPLSKEHEKFLDSV